MSGSPRPRSVTLTTAGVVTGGLILFWQAAALLRERPLLTALNAGPDPFWRAALAVLLALLFWGTAVALWRRRPWARYGLPLLLALLLLLRWSDLIFFVQSDVTRRAWPAISLLYGGALLWTLWALNRRSIAAYWRPHPSGKS